MLNLPSLNPELHIDDSRPQELVAAAAQLAAWDERTLASADTLLEAWTLRACMNDDPEGTADLVIALRALLERLPSSGSVPAASRHRWQAYLDLLNTRTLRFTGDAEIAVLLQRPHVGELLGVLPANGAFLAQGEIKNSLQQQGRQFSDSRLSQILGQIEDHGLIDHRRRGKYKDWRLTESGRRFARTLSERSSAAVAPSRRRGIGLLAA